MKTCTVEIWPCIVTLTGMCDIGAQTWQGKLLGMGDMVKSLSELTGVCAILTACIHNEKGASDHRLKHLSGQEIRAGPSISGAQAETGRSL